MTALTAFLKKEFLAIFRTGKAVGLLFVFLLFGIMNPAIAKLTPWMMEMMADSMAETGLSVTAVEVNALTSWTQFYKNTPIAIILFLLMFSNILTEECQCRTLINMITKGLPRWKVLAAKATILLIVWTVGYWMMFGVTYAYNRYFWNDTAVWHSIFAAFCVYLLGIWLISFLLFVSVFVHSNTIALAATGGCVIGMYLLSFIPAICKYFPIYCMSASSLLTNSAEVIDFLPAIVITVILIVGQSIASIFCFNNKQL
ncbi:MAG: ABC transporter permease subunit [Candidatus Fimimorpha sp.]